MAAKIIKKCEKPSLEPVFGLSVMGNSRHMVGSVVGGAAPYVTGVVELIFQYFYPDFIQLPIHAPLALMQQPFSTVTAGHELCPAHSTI